ncbi:hypothetical protein N7478_008112 [Penicillium angulare]|uniref:uncharacterized protein n=1 Tax=Penicillium angulare TaxID=116970 RepID=UPI002541F36C|nr:uncharacterized protein N7478_008112 [Penicillium angulare]KAJ5272987.1 hypothetical protein N7478_008112 [Penicillium angulare]
MASTQQGTKRKRSPHADGNKRPAKKAIKRGQRSDTVNLTGKHRVEGMEDLPSSLRRKNIAECVVEFIDELQTGGDDSLAPREVGPPTNHTIIRLIFQHEVPNNASYAPAGSKGVILHF